MDLRSLRYFVAVAESRSVTRAAEILNVSQPAVSRAVRQLEGEMGKVLLTRTGHGVLVTAAGKLLLSHAHSILRQVEQTRDIVKQTEDDRQPVMITVALPPGAGQKIAPELMKWLRDHDLNITLKLFAGYASQIHDWLQQGAIDVSVMHEPVIQRGQTIKHISDEEVVVVGAAGSFPHDRPKIWPRELSGLTMILPSRPNASRLLLDAFSISWQVRLDASMEVDDHGLAMSLVQAGAGFTLLTRPNVTDNPSAPALELRPFANRIDWRLCVVSVNREDKADAIAAVVEGLTFCVAELKREPVLHDPAL